ncbi:hypothetical protein [Pasteuria penetrans]|nr:hypothetical protein [Pasteuria penetrans]
MSGWEKWDEGVLGGAGRMLGMLMARVDIQNNKIIIMTRSRVD